MGKFLKLNTFLVRSGRLLRFLRRILRRLFRRSLRCLFRRSEWTRTMFQSLVYEWVDTAFRESNVFQQLVQLGIISHRQCDVARNDSLALVSDCRFTGYLYHFSRQVFTYCGQVHCTALSYQFGIISGAQFSANATNWED